MEDTYRGYTLYENIGPLAMKQRPGVFTVGGIAFTGTRAECEICVNYEIALKEFRAAHNGVVPEEVHDYADLEVRQDLLDAYNAAYNADYAMRRTRHEGRNDH